MPLEEPDATSTPTAVPRLKGRKSVRDQDQISVQSPIDSETTGHPYGTRSSLKSSGKYLESARPSSFQKSPSRSPNKSPRSQRINESIPYGYSESDHSSEADDYETQEQEIQRTDKSPGSFNFLRNVGVFILLCSIPLGFLYYSPDNPEEISHQAFNSLGKDFNKQDEDFWRNIRVNIQEIPVLEQPRSILFIYNHKGEETMNKILKAVSAIALCSLSDCSNKAIVIEGASLNTSEIINDYGKIISKHRDSLDKNGVMIVKNLEKVPGVSAQAFHSICDDYNPLVKKALILFTLKVKSLPENYPMKVVENILLNLWNDIGKDDKFYPLFTRISSTILTVKPE